MKITDFNELSEERDADFVTGLYLKFRDLRRECRDWIVTEIKEQKLELDRRLPSSGGLNKVQLEKLYEQVQDLDKGKHGIATEEVTQVMENAEKGIWASVDEPAFSMLQEFEDLLKIVKKLADMRQLMESIS
ncbi:MAG: hypothetical protein OXR67_13420 [Chloroflexota bacterium]|nr:hypothetical protein [Chloroflexota bacterium]